MDNHLFKEAQTDHERAGNWGTTGARIGAAVGGGLGAKGAISHTYSHSNNPNKIMGSALAGGGVGAALGGAAGYGVGRLGHLLVHGAATGKDTEKKANMIKLSTEHIKTVLTKVATTLRTQSTKIAELEEELEHHKKKDRAEELAKRMEEKNINSEHSHEEKVAKLMVANDLDVIERAIDMSSDKFDKIANVDSQAGNSTDSFSQLFSYVLGET